MTERDRMIRALKAADAAGDTEAATKLAQALRNMGEEDPEKEKAGVTRSLADSIIELGTGILGAPADIAEAMGFEPVLPTSTDLEAGLAEFDFSKTAPGRALGAITEPFGGVTLEGPVHSGVGTPVGMDERTRGGEIAKAGGDVAALGSVISTAPLAFTKGIQQAPQAVSTLGRIAQDIVKTTAANPKSVAFAEGVGNVGAGVGTSVGEAAAPGDDTVQLVTGTVGALAPTAAIPYLVKHAGPAFAKVASIFTKSGQEARAGDLVRKMVEANGGDVDGTIRLLLAAEDVGESSALKTGDEGLIRLENYIRQKSPDTDRALSEQNRQAMEEMRGMIDRLTATGDPQALKIAAVLREDMYRDAVDRTVNAAQGKAATASGKLVTEETAESTGESAAGITDQAYNMLKQTENQLWAKVPDDVELGTINTAQALEAAADSVTQELFGRRVPADVRAALARVTGTKTQNVRQQNRFKRPAPQPAEKPVTSGDLKVLRSDLLKEARAAESGPNPNADSARILREIADGLTKDMQDLPGYAEATAFTRAFRERFNQSFAGQTRQSGPQGAKMEPGETLQKGFGGGGPTANRRFNELESAAGMADSGLSTAMRIEQEKFLRTVAEKFVKEDGTIGAGLDNFLLKNKAMLERFPQLKTDLMDAKNRTAILKGVKEQAGARMKALERSAIADVVGDENPANVIGRIMSGKTPDADFKELANTAKRAGKEAVAGLNTAALQNAGANSKSFEQLKENSKAVLAQLRKNGLMSEGEITRLENAINRAVTLENNAARTSGRAGNIGDSEEIMPMLDSLVRMVGSSMGTTVHGAIPGAKGAGTSLIAAQQGSKWLRGLIEKNPFNKTMEILQVAAQNPSVMADLMRKHGSVELQKQAWARVRGALIAAGVMSEEEG